MVYNSVKYVQIGEKKEWSCNGLFISAHLIIMEIFTTTFNVLSGTAYIW